jgi:hypothetical protein
MRTGSIPAGSARQPQCTERAGNEGNQDERPLPRRRPDRLVDHFADELGHRFHDNSLVSGMGSSLRSAASIDAFTIAVWSARA